MYSEVELKGTMRKLGQRELMMLHPLGRELAILHGKFCEFFIVIEFTSKFSVGLILIAGGTNGFLTTALIYLLISSIRNGIFLKRSANSAPDRYALTSSNTSSLNSDAPRHHNGSFLLKSWCYA